jgi:hypothetical protein
MPYLLYHLESINGSDVFQTHGQYRHYENKSLDSIMENTIDSRKGIITNLPLVHRTLISTSIYLKQVGSCLLVELSTCHI